MRKTVLALSLLTLLVSCQKEVDFQNGSPGSTTGSTSNSNDYQPTTANSEWRMKSTSLGDYTLRSLGTDTTVNGTKFFKFDHTFGGRQYVSKQAGVYKQLAKLPQTGDWVFLIYLKDAASGTTWTETIGGAEMRYAVTGTGLQRTVNGKQYSNVIHIRYEQFASGMKTATGDQYYAKGVGPIESISRMDMFGMQSTIDSTYLVSSTIK